MPNHQTSRALAVQPQESRESLQRPLTPSMTPHADTNTAMAFDPLLTAEDVAKRLKVSTDWVWDHSSRKKPFLPVIRMGDGALRYRASGIEAFIDERERLSALRRRAN